ncbi:MAG TPA: ATP-dependent DNA helicase [Galbitalea sp.]|nr:ATP-dependent DNA helicase [Galbitalea sp.]
MTSAIEIADALGRPRPTDQQIRVIESPLSPALVVAGAGSGKTETMASRVLWLLANRHARPSEILGLTFTRKAAGELSGRIRARIQQLADAGLVTDDYDPFEAPTVSTYNSFANSIYRDNAMLIGREGDGEVLGSASAWQLARSLVVASRDQRLVELDKRVDDVTKAVLALSAAVTENIVDPNEVRTFAAAFAALAELPGVGRYAYEDAAVLARTVGSLDVLLDLAERFSEAKRRRGFIEFSDQVALALQIVRGSRRIRTEFRDQFRVVLLDEYQDTSVVQTWLLSELFAGHPVMAVGDPNQSIYGWRGASAANLESFSQQFGAGEALDFNLSTSWRNGHDILAVANALVEPLLPHTRVRVERLNAGPLATDRTVDVSYDESVKDEAESAALWLKHQLAALKGADGEPPTAAMLFRARKSQQFFLEALRKHDVPFHVLGVGGLLATPEIADLVSALTVVSNPGAGNELIRLLAGSRWRIGVRDLRFLRRLASWLNKRDLAQQPLAEDVVRRLRNSVAEGEGGSIVDALDFLATAPVGHSQLAEFSDVGVERLRDAARTFSWLRSRAGLDLLDFVTLVEQELRLDIEVLANEHLPLGGANKEAFFDALAGYIAVDDSASLGGFLGWLREAEWRDGLSPRPEDPEPGTVQILTIHGAKGLEWDAVVVPRLVDDELPTKPREGYNGWLAFGQLPWSFRGDKNELPEFAWAGHDNRKQLLDARDDFSALVRERHEFEERRLAYVAVTRARHALLLSGSYWATQTKPRGPSPFLLELAGAGIIGELPAGTQNEVNPLGDEVEIIRWPADPLGGRRARVEAAAAAVRAADPGAAGSWAPELDLLLAERAARLDSGRYVELPTRVPASRFKDFVTDPASVASALRRPMPEKPYRATRLGTLFHSWVEERSGVHGSFEELDTLVTESDADGDQLDGAALAKLQATFEKSPWAHRKPVEVEREIHLVLDSQIIICKIDAVYEIADQSGGARYEIVDWKTGKVPKDSRDLEEKQLQLALYSLAYAKWKGIDPGLIDAVFYYVSDDKVIRPARLFDEQELVASWRSSLAIS